MKKITTPLFLLLFFSLNAIDYPNMYRMPNIIDGTKIPGVKPFLGDYLYISQTEVSNSQYKDFLSWLSQNKPGEYISNLPDTSKWNTELAFCDRDKESYFRHPAYGDFPVVNISQKQAENYCNYLHKALKEIFKANKSTIDEFIVRLPTEKEWMLAARGGLPEDAIYPWGNNDVRIGNENKKHKGEFLLNYKRFYGEYSGHFLRLLQNEFYTIPVKSGYPNGYGLYNMSGNVAEWIAEKGKTKGGSWNLPPYNARIDVPGYYDGDTTAKSDIGFRYVIEIISVKDKPKKNWVVDAKYLFRTMSYIRRDTSYGNYLFASSYELTNEDYHLFLKENSLPEYQIQSDNWAKYFPYKYYQIYGWHSAFYNYPVVNISHKAAEAYCKWATDKYNNSEKRVYKKVVFRLPTEKEWENAASSGRNNSPYPWGEPYTRNAKGCYLCNFCPLEDQYLYKKDSVWTYNYPNNDRTVSRCADGLVIPGSVYNYFPNDYFLFNCAGNVAEMVSEPGITKGGSWNSGAHDLEIYSHQTYTEPSPEIGFRVFMEVLEKFPVKR